MAGPSSGLLVCMVGPGLAGWYWWPQPPQGAYARALGVIDHTLVEQWPQMPHMHLMFSPRRQEDDRARGAPCTACMREFTRTRVPARAWGTHSYQTRSKRTRAASMRGYVLGVCEGR
jgi:hypothetical protein